ncbi:MAG: hypothetical protein A2268_01540 [Candidatus Raymondbacteria bacterium RifOxyA12_full_50_37]|uniref:Rubrerythrin diiron-binding domain-containing protein n=1 Tax=Candidatus Raymondbacteria bacterium RIFOXYD12_FULL_49_13 TaxID=1817890 RepID=A0A1F7F9G0_UNCRA|nr:MAG: hypothetical protein A2268_01540 [Candidatus Raymondbacteria bacterium RifOxyA12_full_50_37]OGJ87909.1 MAG: hypothetical protein A2248_01825 [Candidatus Raymondbacteria bacterium RIFOXYA2_FULL_49_16]OGJ99706.1 MAG: hypothetical protein A2350_07600 [Candidatus Raymondbacteria bacterium RifOxyB12_full_50_8]OGK03241.1 MAG: hypothetical protein A2519_13300 [Candidatus Raymondbacteria bacterium RIFOXYD12_FULL_49_13]OGK07603.1 MAG: hypothetical protein A2487_05320 [Candidatus Raymondbacteria 
MSQEFNADQVFGIGVEIEKNGKEFYTAAAQSSAGQSIKTTLEELAKWEDQHIAIFSNLRKNLPATAAQDNTYDPNNEITLYLKAAADNHVFIKNKDPRALAKVCDTPIEVIGIAMNFEKDSVVFYSAMRNAIPAELGKSDIEKLIDEELKHIVILTKILGGLKGKQ